MERLKAIYEEYDRQLGEVRKKAPLFSGVMGLGDSVKNHPCHETFYQGVEAWVQEFAASQPQPQQVLEVLRWMYTTENEKSETYWYRLAVQTHSKPLIPLLEKEDRRELAQWYDQRWPRHKRLPMQNDIYKMLKK